MGAVAPLAVAGLAVAGQAVAPVPVGSDASAQPVTLTFSPVTATDPQDLGASYQGLGAHTMAGAAVHFATNAAVYVTVNDLGAEPAVSGVTMHRTNLTGSGPWTATQVATAAYSVISAAGGDVVDNGDGTLTVQVPDPAAVRAAQLALTDYDGRGGGGTLGVTSTDVGSSAAMNGTAWIQVLPANVPTGTFRVIGFEILRGSNVANGVQISLGLTGTADGNPEGLTVEAGLTAGNSGTNQWHAEYLPHDEVVELSGSPRLFIGVHGDGATSSAWASASINDGTYEDGSSNNLWLTDGTTGSTTPAVSPAGPVTASYNYGVAVRLIIQEAPYQQDGDYTATNLTEGVHDQDLYAPGSEVEDIFVGWGLDTPTLTGLQVKRTRVYFQAYGGAGNTKRFELWDTAGGTSTFAGDNFVALLGETSATQGTGWSDLGHAPISLTPGQSIRMTVKGTTSTGTVFSLDLGGFGIGDVGHPVYALQGGALEDEELEVMASIDETAIDFDPANATADPNNAIGTIQTPGNVGMINLHLGPPAPTVTVPAA